MVGCEHNQIETAVELSRLVDDDSFVKAYRLEFHFRCHDCKAKFEFLGIPKGLSLEHPTVGLTGTELFLPVRPTGGEMVQLDLTDAPAA